MSGTDAFADGMASIVALAQAQAEGTLSAVTLVERYLERIARLDHQTRAVIEINPEAHELAVALDRERAAGRLRGPLHGIPILVKDNIDTADRMQTTAGSLALVGPPAREDAGVVARLRAGGAVILGKTNLSEWANYRSTRSSSGWSGRGRQTRNPHALDRTPSGSSSGAAVAAAAGFAAATLGTETAGSIVSPAGACGVVGIKPTVGLTSRAGVIPIAHSQDTVGPMARTVADAAALLGVIAGPDPRDPATLERPAARPLDYTAFLVADGLRGTRIGVARDPYVGNSEHSAAVFEAALATLRAVGAVLIDPANIATVAAIAQRPTVVLDYEFKAGLNAYLAVRPDLAVRSLADIIAFNTAHAAEELPYFQQEILERAQACGPLTDTIYLDTLAQNHRLAREEGIDAILREHHLDALVAPTNTPASTIDQLTGTRFLSDSASPAALAGYPLVTVPAGQVFGLPINITFMGSAWSEPTLIRLAFAFEQAARAWRRPRFLPTIALP
jgi:amidase